MGGRVLRPPGRVNNLPPTVRCRSLTTSPSLPLSLVAVASFHRPPLLPALVRALRIVQQIDCRCGKRASVIAFFSAPTVVGVPSLPLPLPLPLPSSVLPPSGQEKRPRLLGS